MKLTPQDHTVLRHLETGAYLTPLQALGVYNIYRLGARIYSIKKHFEETGDTRVIATTLVRDPTNRKNYARYSLLDKPVDTENVDIDRLPCTPSPNPLAAMRAPGRFPQPEVRYAA